MPENREDDRELVQRTLSREWGEPAVAVHIGRFDPSFRVAGRRVDGSPRTQHRVRRLFGVVGWILQFVVVAIADLFSSTSSGLGGPSTRSFTGQVRGPEGSSAVQFCAVARGEFWLVLSPSRLAAVKTGSSPPVFVLWSATGPDRPQLDRDAATLRWPDGSSVSFRPESAERQRLAAV